MLVGSHKWKLIREGLSPMEERLCLHFTPSGSIGLLNADPGNRIGYQNNDNEIIIMTIQSITPTIVHTGLNTSFV